MGLIGSITGIIGDKAHKGGVPKPVDYTQAFARERRYLQNPMSSPEMMAADKLITDNQAAATSDMAQRMSDAAARTGGVQSGGFLKGIAQAQNEVGRQAVDQRRQALMQTIAAIQARIAQLRELQAGQNTQYMQTMAGMELGKFTPFMQAGQGWESFGKAAESFSKAGANFAMMGVGG